MSIANREHWLPRLKPLGSAAEFPYERTLSPVEASALRVGLWPRDMDDRWVVYLADTSLAMHRSWSGHAIYSIAFSPRPDGGGLLGPALVSSDGSIYRAEEQPRRDIEMVDYLIERTIEHNKT